MPADLEAQLRASLPGRETAVQDRERAVVAREFLGVIVPILESQRAALAVAVPAGTKLHERLTEALLLLRQVHSDLERVVIPRMR